MGTAGRPGPSSFQRQGLCSRAPQVARSSTALPSLRPPVCVAAPERLPGRRPAAGRPPGGAGPGGAAVPPGDLYPPRQRPWQHYGSGSDSSSGGSGAGSGGRSDGSRATGGARPATLRRRPPLRQQLETCQTAEELHGLLLDVLPDLQAADVAFVWHLAAARGLFGDSGGSGGEGAAGGSGGVDAGLRLHSLLAQVADAHLADMTTVALSTTAWACAISMLPSEQLIERIVDCAERRMYSFRPRQLSALLWASALAAPSSTRLIKACTRLVERGMSLELFEPHDLSVLVWCCGKVQTAAPALLESVLRECIAQADRFDPPSTARLVHGYAMLQLRPPGLLGPLCRRAVKIMDQFDSHDLSLLVSSLGKLLCDPGTDFLAAAACRAASLVDTARPEHLANLVWGFARLEHTPREGRFLSRLCTHVGQRVDDFGGSLLSSVLWALAKLNHAAPASLLEKVVSYMCRELEQQAPATLATTVWALGVFASASPKMAEAHAPRFRRFAAQAGQRLAEVEELSMHDAPSVLIALATLQVAPPPALAQRLVDGCCQAADSLPGDALARTAWAAATLQLRDERLAAAIAHAPAAVQLPAAAIAQFSWALAVLDYQAPALLHAWAVQLCETQSTTGSDCIAPLDKSRILWAYAQLGVYRPVLCDRLLQRLTAKEISRMGHAAVAALLWACAKLQHQPPGHVLDAAAQVVSADLQSFPRVQLLQLGWSLSRLRCADQALISAVAAHFHAPRSAGDAQQAQQEQGEGGEQPLDPMLRRGVLFTYAHPWEAPVW